MGHLLHFPTRTVSLKPLIYLPTYAVKYTYIYINVIASVMVPCPLPPLSITSSLHATLQWQQLVIAN